MTEKLQKVFFVNNSHQKWDMTFSEKRGSELNGPPNILNQRSAERPACKKTRSNSVYTVLQMLLCVEIVDKKMLENSAQLLGE